jgi:hypothetical protein
MPRITREELAEFAGLKRRNRDFELENAGLRRSLKAAMQDKDGMIPVITRSIEPTERGWRKIALHLAVQLAMQRGGVVATAADTVETAQLFEGYLTGVKSPEEQEREEEFQMDVADLPLKESQ